VRPVALLLALIPFVARAQAVTVIDGDTFDYEGRRIRIANVCVPERDEPGGVEATQRLSTLIAGRTVSLECLMVNKYGRDVCYVYLDGQLLRQGQVGPTGGRGVEQCRRAESVHGAGVNRGVDAPSMTAKPAARSFRNCSEVRAARAAPIRAGEPGYASHLDRDGDGVACEPYRKRR
jgi:Excalibur calcium-binding domain